MDAARKNSVKRIKTLLDAGADPDIQDENGNTALIWAAYKNNKECVKTLLETGADPDIQDENGNTALIWAAYKNSAEVVSLLLEAGADPDIQNANGEMVIEWASYHHNLKMINAIKSAIDAKKSGMYAERSDAKSSREGGSKALEVVEMRKSSGSKHDFLPKYRSEELIDAARKNDAKRVKTLLESGADPNFQDEGGWTALIWAAYKNNLECAKALLEAGADPDHNSGSALSWAEYHYNDKMKQMLESAIKSKKNEA